MKFITSHHILRRPGLSASSPVADDPATLATTQIVLPRTLVRLPEHPRRSPEGAVTAALLIDGENCSPELVAPALIEAARHGTVAIRRLYANPTVMRQQRWQALLTKHQIEAVPHERTAIGKNATDIALVVEAMDLLHEGAIGCFCLLASDSDYTPLVKRLRAAGRIVVGIGGRQTPPALTQACSIFITLDRRDATVPAPAVSPVQPPVQLIALPQSDPQLRAATTPAAKPAPSAPRPEPVDPTAMLLTSWWAVHQACGTVSLSNLIVEIELRFPHQKPQTYGYDRFATLIHNRKDLFTIRPDSNYAEHFIVALTDQAAARSSLKVIVERADQTAPRASPNAAMAPATPHHVPSQAASPRTAPSELGVLLERAWQQAPKQDGWLDLSAFGLAIRKLAPTFSARAHGHAQLKGVLKAHAKRFELRQRSNGHWEVRLRP
ncbi:NYN domain-containing protein [Candidatus Chloroploca sp. Khr17]|uniref:NYN domain-containing protein n=1 Tax=Candidatus Chloroploca sp. Khr17 TaxID=2496869 RepID=UPI0013EB141B|nr:PIN domain-containing protein [Candidatus Chloroploca sp. Khr17]